MNISLTEELEQFVLEQVKSGMYHSNSEVIRDGLRLLKRLNGSPQDVRNWYNAQIDIGLQQAEAGEAVPGEASYAKMKRKLSDLDKSAS